MKSFTSAILAAAVSANYCYTDGCNCNGETRACYSVPRQNMRPNAINTCCPVGVTPTVYGINNGRSEFQQQQIQPTVIIPQTASLLKGESNETWSPTASLKKKPEPMCCRNKCQAAGMEKFVSIDTKHGHCGEACMKPSDFSLYKKFERNLEPTTSDTPCKDAGWPVYFETETHGVWPINMTVDLYSQEAPNCAQQCKDTCCNNGGGDACVKACGCEHACPAWSPTSSLMTGTSSSTWSPTSRLSAEPDCIETFKATRTQCRQATQNTDCSKGDNQTRRDCMNKKYDLEDKCINNADDKMRKCNGDAPRSNLQVYGGGNPNTHLAKLNNFVDCRDYQLYCCQEWNRFEWNCLSQGLPSFDTNCSAVVSAAQTAGITADSPGTCAQTSSKKTRTWESKQNAPNTTCKTDCGIKININQPEEPAEEPQVVVPAPQPEEPVEEPEVIVAPVVEPEEPETPEETNPTNDNTFTWKSNTKAPNTKCKKNCGITLNVNQ